MAKKPYSLEKIKIGEPKIPSIDQSGEEISMSGMSDLVTYESSSTEI